MLRVALPALIFHRMTGGASCGYPRSIAAYALGSLATSVSGLLLVRQVFRLPVSASALRALRALEMVCSNSGFIVYSLSL